MGRKSEKSLARKQMKKEEKVKLEIATEKVDKANAIKNPLDLIPPFRKFERNGLKLDIEFERVTEMSKERIDWVLDLTTRNMQKLYEESEWGWKESEKHKEMTEDMALYLIASEKETGKLVAFSHFRFDIECDDEVVYCYEIQVEDSYRRKGVGKFLLQVLELLAYKTSMIKVMLTTFKSNKNAHNFFIDAMKYEVDETNPVEFLFEQGKCYEILSKKIKPNPKAVKAVSHSGDATSEPMQVSPQKQVMAHS